MGKNITITNKNGENIPCSIDDIVSSILDSDMDTKDIIKFFEKICQGQYDIELETQLLKRSLKTGLKQYSDDPVLYQSMKLVSTILKEDYDI